MPSGVFFFPPSCFFFFCFQSGHCGSYLLIGGTARHFSSANLLPSYSGDPFYFFFSLSLSLLNALTLLFSTCKEIRGGGNNVALSPKLELYCAPARCVTLRAALTSWPTPWSTSSRRHLISTNLRHRALILSPTQSTLAPEFSHCTR